MKTIRYCRSNWFTYEYYSGNYFLQKGVIATFLGNFVFPDRYIRPPGITYYPTKEERSNLLKLITSKCLIGKTVPYKHVPSTG